MIPQLCSRASKAGAASKVSPLAINNQTFTYNHAFMLHAHPLPHISQPLFPFISPPSTGLILGDVLFRTHVVMFDASDYPNNVIIGIGKQNPAYKIGIAPLILPLVCQRSLP
jgi:hypothetical protein